MMQQISLIQLIRNTMNKTKKLFLAALSYVLLASVFVFFPVYAVGEQNGQGGSLSEQVLSRVKTASIGIFNNHFLKGMNEAKNRIQNNNKIEPTAKDAVLAEINKEITWFTQQRDSIEKLNTVDEVRGVVRTARTRYENDRRDMLRLMVAKGYVTSLESVIKVLDINVVPRLQDVVTKLKAAGVDASAEQTALDNAKTYIAMAQAKVLDIKNSTSLEQAKTAFNEAHDYLKQARDYLETVRSTLKSKLDEKKPTATPTVSN